MGGSSGLPGEDEQRGQGVWRRWARRWRAHDGRFLGRDGDVALVSSALIDSVEINRLLDFPLRFLKRVQREDISFREGEVFLFFGAIMSATEPLLLMKRFPLFR